MNYRDIKVIFFGYVVVISLGTILLYAPFSTHENIAFIDALFTATSATCVTGLIVLSTSGDFTIWGQLIILLLIQIGGIGYMTMVTLFFIFLKERLEVDEKRIFKTSLGMSSTKSVAGFIKMLVMLVLVIELIGATILALYFAQDYDLNQAIWFGIFHAISAFNNAGFSLFTNSIMDYDNSLVVILTLSALIITGGLGYLVLTELHQKKTLKFSRFSLHTKITLTATLFLLVSAIILFFSLEYNNAQTLGGLSWREKLINALFLAVNFRTSGFNSIDIGAMQDSSLFFSTVYMIIGGGQGGTAGGIKVTTFAILIIAVIYTLKESTQDPHMYGRTIEQTIINKSLATLLTASFLVLIATVILVETQKLPFLPMLFEVVSAFGTVGLSTGNGDILSLSQRFDGLGKSVVILLMLAGRLGIFAFGVLLVGKAKRHYIKHPKGSILI